VPTSAVTVFWIEVDDDQPDPRFIRFQTGKYRTQFKIPVDMSMASALEIVDGAE
jgi:hypothetical protein